MDGAFSPRLSASDLPTLKVSQLRVEREGGGGGLRAGLCSDRVKRRELHGNKEMGKEDHVKVLMCL